MFRKFHKKPQRTRKPCPSNKSVGGDCGECLWHPSSLAVAHVLRWRRIFSQKDSRSPRNRVRLVIVYQFINTVEFDHP